MSFARQQLDVSILSFARQQTYSIRTFARQQTSVFCHLQDNSRQYSVLYKAVDVSILAFTRQQTPVFCPLQGSRRQYSVLYKTVDVSILPFARQQTSVFCPLQDSKRQYPVLCKTVDVSFLSFARQQLSHWNNTVLLSPREAARFQKIDFVPGITLRQTVNFNTDCFQMQQCQLVARCYSAAKRETVSATIGQTARRQGDQCYWGYRPTATTAD